MVRSKVGGFPSFKFLPSFQRLSRRVRCEKAKFFQKTDLKKLLSVKMSTPSNESHNMEDHESRSKRAVSVDRQPSSRPTTAKEKEEKDAYLHDEMNKEDALCLDRESEIKWVAHVLALIQEREDTNNGVKGEKSKTVDELTVDELIEKLKEDIFSDNSDLEKSDLTKRPSNKTKNEWYTSLHEKLKKLKDDEAKDKSTKNLNEIFNERFIDATKSIEKCIKA